MEARSECRTRDFFRVPAPRNNASLYRKRNATFNKAGGRNFFKSSLSFYFSANFSARFDVFSNFSSEKFCVDVDWKDGDEFNGRNDEGYRVIFNGFNDFDGARFEQ